MGVGGEFRRTIAGQSAANESAVTIRLGAPLPWDSQQKDVRSVRFWLMYVRKNQVLFGLALGIISFAGWFLLSARYSGRITVWKLEEPTYTGISPPLAPVHLADMYTPLSPVGYTRADALGEASYSDAADTPTSDEQPATIPFEQVDEQEFARTPGHWESLLDVPLPTGTEPNVTIGDVDVPVIDESVLFQRRKALKAVPPSFPNPWADRKTRAYEYLGGRESFYAKRAQQPFPFDMVEEPSVLHQEKATTFHELYVRLMQEIPGHANVSYDKHAKPIQIPTSSDTSPDAFHVAQLLADAKQLPRVQASPEDFARRGRPLQQQNARREWVRRTFLHAWDGYKQYAWGHDELQPLSNATRDNYNGWGATIVDNLDTLLLMNLTTEYNLAREHVRRLDFTQIIDGQAALPLFKIRPTNDDLDIPTLVKQNEGWVPPGTQAADPWAPSHYNEDHYTKMDALGFWRKNTSRTNRITYANYRLDQLDIPAGLRSHASIPTFETIIRYVGGLVSGYELSKDDVLLTKAKELADWLLPAFETEQGLPHPRYFIGSKLSAQKKMGPASLAEVGSSVLEFTRLSLFTGDDKYYQVVKRAMDTLHYYFESASDFNGRLGALLPMTVDTWSPRAFSNFYTLGAMADSYFEYLIKMHHMVSGALSQFGTRYAETIADAKKYLIKYVNVVPHHPEILVPGDSQNQRYTPRYQHLSCYVGGMMGLGARLLKRPDDIPDAINVTHTCAWSYESSPTGLGPEILFFYDPDNIFRYHAIQASDHRTFVAIPSGHPAGVRQREPIFHIRPETIESIFYMYRLTADPYWQDLGWTMFVDTVEKCITPSGLASIKDVYSTDPQQHDELESFVLAETLKYYYLLFSPPELLSLDDWVFSTEAHPFRVLKADSAQVDSLPRPGESLWGGRPRANPLHNADDSRTYNAGTPPQKWFRVVQAKETLAYWLAKFRYMVDA